MEARDPKNAMHDSCTKAFALTGQCPSKLGDTCTSGFVWSAYFQQLEEDKRATTSVQNGLVFFLRKKKSLNFGKSWGKMVWKSVEKREKVWKSVKKCRNDSALQLLPFSFSLKQVSWRRQSCFSDGVLSRDRVFRPQKHYLQRHFRASKIALSEARFAPSR